MDGSNPCPTQVGSRTQYRSAVSGLPSLFYIPGHWPSEYTLPACSEAR